LERDLFTVLRRPNRTRFVAAALFVAAAILCPYRATAEDPRASDLLADCDSPEAAAFLYCVAYFEGISDAIQGLKFAGFDVGVCFPEEATVGQSVFLVRDWIRENPAYHDLRPVQAVLPALKSVYPCDTPSAIGANDQENGGAVQFE
jgi:hypothetical protein